MSNTLTTTVILGKINLDVDYIFDEGQKSDGVHTPPIAPSVEIFDIRYLNLTIIDVVNEIDSDLFNVKLENEILKKHDIHN